MAAIRYLEMPPPVMRAPAKTKPGIAMSVFESSAENILCATMNMLNSVVNERMMMLDTAKLTAI
ncbi:MAG: hypothetical protein A4E73_00241 [Syntrophaceae bacterium PtaU1.Bin231]|nr:MAG: hypothetical protein A4E73_00241 [Syntrophaceae bacterium PtaU1.Bin231]